jgi:hypothetical protein
MKNVEYTLHVSWLDRVLHQRSSEGIQSAFLVSFFGLVVVLLVDELVDVLEERFSFFAAWPLLADG